MFPPSIRLGICDLARHVQTHRGDAAALGQFLDYLRCQGVVPREKVPPCRLNPIEKVVRTFERYIRDERALSEAAVVNYVLFVRKFLADRFGNGPVRLSRLRAGDVVRFVRRQASRLHLRRAKLLTSALRSFLHYARYRGDIRRDLAAAVPAVANWSMTSIPRAIPTDAVSGLLASINRHTSTGGRDYAILLLLATFGECTRRPRSTRSVVYQHHFFCARPLQDRATAIEHDSISS